MSKDGDLEKALRRPVGDYEVGYGKPPKEYRFKLGQSGNPRGRPPGTRKRQSLDEPLSHIVFEEAGKLVSVNESGRKSFVALGRLVVRQAGVNAAKGVPRALAVFLKLMTEANDRRERRREELRAAALDYRETWYAEAARRRRQTGAKSPMLLPHAGNQHGDVWVQGPLHEEDKPGWAFLRRQEKLLAAEVEEIRRELAKSGNDAEYIRLLRRDLARNQRLLKIVRRALEGVGPAR